MALTYSKHVLQRLASDGAVKATPIQIYAILLSAGASAAARLELTDNADGSGTNVLHLAAVTGESKFFDFTSVGGVNFPTKCYGDITGSGAVAFIWYDNA